MTPSLAWSDLDESHYCPLQEFYVQTTNPPSQNSLPMETMTATAMATAASQCNLSLYQTHTSATERALPLSRPIPFVMAINSNPSLNHRIYLRPKNRDTGHPTMGRKYFPYHHRTNRDLSIHHTTPI